jgi:hypothetical protein
MPPPFTTAQFFNVFRLYNEGVWPAQAALLVAGSLVVFAAYRANARSSWRWAQFAIVLLAALWLWTGFTYHKHYFATLTTAGEIFGSFFIAQAVLLLFAAWQDNPNFTPTSRSGAIAGAGVLSYALVIYPAIGVLAGHHYPATPTFGVPCPTTIFTFGIYCLLPASIPRFAVAIPVLFPMIASYAALGFGVPQDFGLIAAAAIAILVMHNETHRAHVPRLAL